MATGLHERMTSILTVVLAAFPIFGIAQHSGMDDFAANGLARKSGGELRYRCRRAQHRRKVN
jgi:hypothetical protein